MGLNMAQWLAKYQELINLDPSKGQRGWHTWVLKYHDAETSNEHMDCRSILSTTPLPRAVTPVHRGDPIAYLQPVPDF